MSWQLFSDARNASSECLRSVMSLPMLRISETWPFSSLTGLLVQETHTRLPSRRTFSFSLCS
jgi:hypothetical protein